MRFKRDVQIVVLTVIMVFLCWVVMLPPPEGTAKKIDTTASKFFERKPVQHGEIKEY